MYILHVKDNFNLMLLFLQWCPPCMRLLPEFRKAARDYNGGVNFGTVDCTIHGDLCQVVSEKTPQFTFFCLEHVHTTSYC